jgi:hypothetical protein
MTSPPKWSWKKTLAHQYCGYPSFCAYSLTEYFSVIIAPFLIAVKQSLKSLHPRPSKKCAICKKNLHYFEILIISSFLWSNFWEINFISKFSKNNLNNNKNILTKITIITKGGSCVCAKGPQFDLSPNLLVRESPPLFLLSYLYSKPVLKVTIKGDHFPSHESV